MENLKRASTVFGIGVAVLLLVAVGAARPACAAETSSSAATKERKVGVNLAPFVPTPVSIVDAMLKMADVKSTDVVYDLGCGDGRIVVEAAKKYGARGVGVDYDPERVREARERAKQEGVEKSVTIIRADAMKVDVSSATVVTLYLLPESNARLRPRLEKLLPVGARVVSHDFGMPPPWKEVKKERLKEEGGRYHTLYMWIITAEMKSRPEKQPGPG